MIAFKDFHSSTPGSPLSDGMDRSLVGYGMKPVLPR